MTKSLDTIVFCILIFSKYLSEITLSHVYPCRNFRFDCLYNVQRKNWFTFSIGLLTSNAPTNKNPLNAFLKQTPSIKIYVTIDSFVSLSIRSKTMDLFDESISVFHKMKEIEIMIVYVKWKYANIAFLKKSTNSTAIIRHMVHLS